MNYKHETNTSNDKCTICGKVAVDAYVVKNNFEYVRCKNCGHVYLNTLDERDILISSYREGKRHNVSQNKEEWDYSEVKYKTFYEPLLSHISDISSVGGKLLDIGCSNGAFVHAGIRFGWEAAGVELEKGSIEIARSHNLKIYTNPLEDIEFQCETFSVITMWQVIEHLYNPGVILKEIARILRPGGILAISTPNIRSIGWFLLREKWNPVAPPDHIHLFTPKSLAILARDQGFDVANVDTLDIKPATIREYLFGKMKHDNIEKDLAIENIASSNQTLLRAMIFIRGMLNPILNITGSGEDIYAYFKKF